MFGLAFRVIFGGPGVRGRPWLRFLDGSPSFLDRKPQPLAAGDEESKQEGTNIAVPHQVDPRQLMGIQKLCPFVVHRCWAIRLSDMSSTGMHTPLVPKRRRRHPQSFILPRIQIGIWEKPL